MDDTHPPAPERRIRNRQPAAIPIQIDTEARHDRIGIIWNLSDTGALVGTSSRFQIADRAVLHLRPEGGEPHDLEARIVRLEVADTQSGGVFRYRMAVRFLEPLPEGLR
jgi:hypothetical protein